MTYPMQTLWKVKKDKVSQFTGKVLWNYVKMSAYFLNSHNDYNFINRAYDAQIKLWQINDGNRIS